MFSEQDIEAGTLLLDRFEVIELIGRGGMGVVYKAIDHELNDQIVAIKVLQPQYLNDVTMFARFRKEVAIARSLTHSGIVRTHDLFRTREGVSFISMEYVSGRSLKILKRNPDEHLSKVIERLLDPLDKLLEALIYAHSQGVVHRDLKPANIILTEQGEIKVADFGTARVLSESTGITETGYVIGTPDYMSPEHINGGTIDERSDIYSLSILLYELIVGERPFSAPTAVGIAYMHVHESLPRLGDNEELSAMVNDGLIEKIDNVLGKAGAKDSEDRYASVKNFRKALFEVLITITNMDRSVIFEESGLNGSDEWHLGDSEEPVFSTPKPNSKKSKGTSDQDRKLVTQNRGKKKEVASYIYRNKYEDNDVSQFKSGNIISLLILSIKYISFSVVLFVIFLLIVSPGFVSFVKSAFKPEIYSKADRDLQNLGVSEKPTVISPMDKEPGVPMVVPPSDKNNSVNGDFVKNSPGMLPIPSYLPGSIVDVTKISFRSFTLAPDIILNEIPVKDSALEGFDMIPDGSIKWIAEWESFGKEIPVSSVWVNVFSPRMKRVLARSEAVKVPQSSDGSLPQSGSFIIKFEGTIGEMLIEEGIELLRLDLIHGGELKASIPIRMSGLSVKDIPEADLSSSLDDEPLNKIPDSDPVMESPVRPLLPPVESVSPVNTDAENDKVNGRALSFNGMIDIYPPFGISRTPHPFSLKLNEHSDRTLSGSGKIDGVGSFSVSGRLYDNSIKIVLVSEVKSGSAEVLTLIGERKEGTIFTGTYQSSRSSERGFWRSEIR
ncbi:MAG TPA: serine/threonine-protein kinase [Oligoflexia bacterium]|nr:serine/threonine-protein kinase [Oligoflexia bacterium]HMP47199.1 serine/threonine-protein kinase [Oligoflexia bacterium]